jgi:transposase-like protein
MAIAKLSCPYCGNEVDFEDSLSHETCTNCNRTYLIRRSPPTYQTVLLREEDLRNFMEASYQWYREGLKKNYAKEVLEHVKKFGIVKEPHGPGLSNGLRSHPADLPVEKFWDTANDEYVCEYCTRNEAAGWVPLDLPFPSGHQQPQAHPGCRCDLRIRHKQ